MTIVRRLIAVLGAIVLAIFAVPATGAPSVAASPEPVHAYACDSHLRSAALSYTITGRGPPVSYEHMDAVCANGTR